MLLIWRLIKPSKIDGEDLKQKHPCPVGWLSGVVACTGQQVVSVQSLAVINYQQ